METINNLMLRDESVYPDETVLKSVLGESHRYYSDLLDLFDKNNMEGTWRYYNDGKAWLCKVQFKKKTVTWMSAWEGYMQATIYLPLRLLNEALSLDLDDRFKERFTSAKDVGKSKPCIFQIDNGDEVLNFEKLMQFKIKSK